MELYKSSYVRFDEAPAEMSPVNAPDFIKPIAQTTKKYSKTMLISIAFFLFTFILSVAIAYSKNSNHGLGTYATINRPFQDDVARVPDNFTGLAIYGNITSIDPRTFTFKIHFSILPKGQILDTRDDLNRTPRGQIILIFDSQTERFPANQIISSPDISITFKSGNPITYPFDEYTADFFISASWWDPDANER